MIDFDNIKTIPNSILSLVRKNKYKIRKELILEGKMQIAGHKRNGGTVSTENYMDCFYNILDLLKNEKIVGYHCTKHIDPSRFLKEGLSTLNPDVYEFEMKNFLKSKVTDSMTIKKIDKCFLHFKEIGGYSNRMNMIWFLINKSLIHENGCQDFLEYYGGEIIRRITCEIEDSIYPLLRKTGVPTVVSFLFNFNDLEDYQKHNLVKVFIESHTLDKSYKYYSKMRAEGNIKRDIKPEEIIQVFQNIDIEKLKNTVAKV